jgi:hypothetical protein
MRLSGTLVIAVTDDDVVGRHHDGANQRIRAGPAAAAPGVE